MELVKNCGWFLPYKNICICSEKPCRISLNADKILHCETGAAIEYRDGYAVYALNGIRVPKEIVLTPANKLDPTMIIKEKNVEIRRELLRKIGLERFVQKLGAKTIDTFKIGENPDILYDVYELLEINIKGMVCKGLKMKNASIGIYHIEFVASEITTAKEALNWRYYGMIDFSKDEFIGIA